jgi:glutaminyl-peptide cyclotransferase
MTGLNRLIFVFPLLALPFSGCSESGGDAAAVRIDPLAVDGQKALANVKKLVAIVPRDSGTAGAMRAAEQLRDALTPNVDVCRIDQFEDDTPRGRLEFRNVIGVIKGSGDGLVILGSHYDTKSGISEKFQGANDSGSSSGLLLELARVLHAGPKLPFSVIFVFFDGEESMEEYGVHDGLHGSRRMAKMLVKDGRAERVRAMILLDMIGDRDLTVTLPRNGDHRLRKLTLKAASSVGIRQKIRLSRSAVLDDHAPFRDVGIPAIDIIDFEYGSAPGKNDYWHTDADTVEHISAQSLSEIGRLVIHVLNALASE